MIDPIYTLHHYDSIRATMLGPIYTQHPHDSIRARSIIAILHPHDRSNSHLYNQPDLYYDHHDQYNLHSLMIGTNLYHYLQ